MTSIFGLFKFWSLVWLGYFVLINVSQAELSSYELSWAELRWGVPFGFPKHLPVWNLYYGHYISYYIDFREVSQAELKWRCQDVPVGASVGLLMISSRPLDNHVGQLTMFRFKGYLFLSKSDQKLGQGRVPQQIYISKKGVPKAAGSHCTWSFHVCSSFLIHN